MAPLWQRAYLDAAAVVALLLVWRAMRGMNLQGGGPSAVTGDPALYILPAILLVAAGLVAVRLLGWLLRWLDRALGPTLGFVAALPLRRIGRMPGQFAPMVLLLCLTAGLGTYSAAAARTLDSNLAAAVRYRVGAPVRLEQISPCSVALTPAPVCGTYGLGGPPPRALPPFSLNLGVPGVTAATQLVEMPLSLPIPGHTDHATLVLVDTATFAHAAWWDPHLDPLPEAHYLQLLASAPDAVLVSPSLPGSIPGGGTIAAQLADGPLAHLQAVGTIARWPGADAAGPMVIAPLAAGAALLGLTCAPPPPSPPGAPGAPCAGQRVVLMDLAPGATAAGVEAALTPLGLSAGRTDVAATEVADALATPEWAGQTGMLTIGFLIALAITAVGYLLYASVLLRGQVGQIGLLRALGLDWPTLIGGVALEQGILMGAGAIAGILAGLAAGTLFLPLFQPAFTGPDAPPFLVIGPGGALWQVAAVLGVLFAATVTLLLALLRRLHIGETVKLEG